LLYAVQSGLKPETVLQSVGAGAASSWALNNLLPRVMKKDYQPGFFVHHFLKDIQIALQEAEAMKIDLPGLKLARELYQKLANLNGTQLGTQALYKVYEESVKEIK